MRRLKLWHWLILAGLPIYFTLATFLVYGGFFIGSPPLTPAWLNTTRIPIERNLLLERQTSLHVYGELSAGRIELELDGKVLATFVSGFDERFTLSPGKHRLIFRNTESSGMFNYRLE